jgi:Tfp pilus assembly protein PilO
MNQIKNLKKQILLTTLVCLLLIGGIFYFFILPQVQKIKETKNEIESRRFDLERKYIQGQNLKELSENIKTVQEKIPELEKIYIKKEDSLEFITTMENIAEKNGINQKLELNPADETKIEKGQYIESTLRISLSGHYLNVLSYLKDIETLRYCINIENLEINSSGNRSEEESEGTINLNIQSKVYWSYNL